MPRVIFTENAVTGLVRCRKFLNDKNPAAARRAAGVISTHFTLLETASDIGRPFGESTTLRELIIPFGNSGYVAMYRRDELLDSIFVLAFRHQKEAGY